MVKSNAQVAAFFRRIADLLELRGENPFKTKSYRTAADTIEEMREPIATAAQGGAVALQKIPGIGKSIGGQIVEFVETGTSATFERLRAEIPETAADLLRLRGVGMKTARSLHEEFGVLGLEDLRDFAAGGGLEMVAGLADRTASRIVSSVDQLLRDRPKMSLADAERLAATLGSDFASGVPALGVVTPVGQMRRRRDPVFAIELLATTAGDVAAATAAAARLHRSVDVATPGRVEFTTSTRLPAILYVAPERERWVALVRTTGSVRHVRELEDLARRRGLELRGYALVEATPEGNGAAIALEDEHDFYAQLGLRFIPPELREGTGEIEDAAL